MAGCRPAATSLRSWTRSCSDREWSRLSVTSPHGDSSSCGHSRPGPAHLCLPPGLTEVCLAPGTRAAAGPTRPRAIHPPCRPARLSPGQKASASNTKAFPAASRESCRGQAWGQAEPPRPLSLGSPGSEGLKSRRGRSCTGLSLRPGAAQLPGPKIRKPISVLDVLWERRPKPLSPSSF